MQGGSDPVIESLSRGDLAAAALPDPERRLLEFVELLTRHAYQTRDADVQRLRDAGWREEQIAEAVYITALFAFFNRVADAFGLDDPGYRQLAAAGVSEGLPVEVERKMQSTDGP